MAVDEDLEQLMGHLGEFGKYQMRQFLLHILAALTAGLHMLTFVTVAAVPEHRCLIPDVDVNASASLASSWDTEELRRWVPRREDGSWDGCHMLDPATNASLPCESWVYDSTYYTSSRSIEWDLVCGRRWMGAVAQAAYMFGVFAGAVTLGSLADKYGRKTIFYICAVLQLILGVAVAFVPEFWTLLVVRFFYGVFGSAGAYITGFVLTMELVGPSKRTACGITFQGFFAGGVMLVAFWGYFIRERVLLQVVYGLHGLLLVGHWWLIDESPRWLWSQGRVTEAVTIVEKAVRVNGGEAIDTAHYVSKGKSQERQREDVAYGISDLFRTPNMRAKMLNCCLNWFANSLCYYGLSLNTGKLAGDPFIILFLVGLVEIPSYVVTILLMDRTGRRSLISAMMILGGVATLAAAFIPQTTSAGNASATTVVMIGKFMIAGSFAIIYNYTAELFPTPVRNTALGVGSMCARLSGALTPLITLLDSLDKTLPTVIFATIAVTSGLLSLLLPETLNQPMPQSMEDGEQFGKGDTACASCFGRKPVDQKYEIPLTTVD
ncbi:organic cation transporter protein [Frankliniella occidentalis]|uniref:Organic cation transporter protein n=1 Tax=Frankliniella occidentalis TaxID=133901 RepID=A0A6J1TRZ3_FRAOC|nr:organic cation transporter protein [Frankliniella occidentalis]